MYAYYNIFCFLKQVLSRWPLFGSSFFAVRRVSGGGSGGGGGGGEWREYVLALNRRGVHLLHPATHDTDAHWPYADLISTRKVGTTGKRSISVFSYSFLLVLLEL